MSAAKLREAAALMRARAEAATPGEWGVGNGSHVAVGVEQTGPGSFSADFTIADLDSMMRSDYGEPDFDEHVEADAEHIASWHPAVALAVADWLDEVAWRSEHYPKQYRAAKHALAVARAYLGGDQ